ncbi:hypothetical protein D9758_009223 [Tetrapyrgos nigripes]|uniref:Uncharacterized protein n=1 Tax=Tetrapyrgos nigripes TaxID=182062 RepID=A0A8H5FWW7_9AGAR|nr:hypothetical protein D9758_009223 [Tetrapyrgos nigripes]
MSEFYRGESSSSGRWNLPGPSQYPQSTSTPRAFRTSTHRHAPLASTSGSNRSFQSSNRRPSNVTPQRFNMIQPPSSGDRRASIMTPATSTSNRNPAVLASKTSSLWSPWHDADLRHTAESNRTRKDIHSKRPETIRKWQSHARKRASNVEDDESDVEMESAYSDSGSDAQGEDERPPSVAKFINYVAPNVGHPAVRKITAAKSARKRVEVISDDDEEEEDEENSSSSEDDDDQGDVPSQTESEENDDGDDSDSSDSVEFIEDEPCRRRRPEQMDISPTSSRGGSPFVTPVTSIMSPALLRAIKTFLPPFSRQNLPMKLSHLRKAFERKCIKQGVMTAKLVDEVVKLSVLYRLAETTSGQSEDDSDADQNETGNSPGSPTRKLNSYGVMFRFWKCPLCSFHGVFNTRQMLKSHLEWDHEDAKVLWDQGTEDDDFTWRIILTFDEPTNERRPLNDLAGRPFIYAHPIYVDSRENTPVPTLGTPTPAPGLKPDIELEELKFRMTSPFMEPSTTRSPSTTPALTDSRTSLEEPRSPSPDFLTGSVPPMSMRSRSTTSFASTTTTDTTTTTETGTTTSWDSAPALQTPPRITRPLPVPSSTTRAGAGAGAILLPFPDLPPPPPKGDSLGPAARHPYLPTRTPQFMVEKYRWKTKYLSHSSRPGGETLYDLLGVLPLEPYGLMAWQVLDTEDEIFESDDLRDECKVIAALWARWMVLNRRKFIANFYFGTMAFIEEYAWMIYWAAGWGALRYQLIILMANRFLNCSQVANLLKHYEGRVEMDSWYKDSVPGAQAVA